MKKKILIPVGMAALFLCASWQEAETTVSPDRLFLADNGKSLFITNRAGCELIKMSSDGQKIEKKVSFSSPVNAMTQDANGKLWVVCDGNYGMMNEMEYRTIGSALAGGYRAAVYCRLSKDDDLQGESASIANQRDMLEKYCEKQGWEVVAVYQDDGFTGLNMERPDLQRMLRAIERRQINLVITKDLSRLGRNYLQTGHLIEDFFPRNGVRYIAMNDGIDTLRDNNDIAPFKNILNEMYSKDISKKVHSSYLLKAQKGQFTGCLAPFGYRKDPEDKNHLLIDEETAPIVRLIFGYALNGHGPNYIRRRLEEEKIPCPTWWNRERGLRNTRTKWEKKDPENGRYMWDFSVIKDLLMNPVYTGAIASQKKDYRFKIGTIGEKKPKNWDWWTNWAAWTRRWRLPLQKQA